MGTVASSEYHTTGRPSPVIADSFKIIQHASSDRGEQRCRCGDSTRFPPMWSGFDLQTGCPGMWVEFVGSLL